MVIRPVKDKYGLQRANAACKWQIQSEKGQIRSAKGKYGLLNGEWPSENRTHFFSLGQVKFLG